MSAVATGWILASYMAGPSPKGPAQPDFRSNCSRPWSASASGATVRAGHAPAATAARTAPPPLCGEPCTRVNRTPPVRWPRRPSAMLLEPPSVRTAACHRTRRIPRRPGALSVAPRRRTMASLGLLLASRGDGSAHRVTPPPAVGQDAEARGGVMVCDRHCGQDAAARAGGGSAGRGCARAAGLPPPLDGLRGEMPVAPPVGGRPGGLEVLLTSIVMCLPLWCTR